MMYCILHICGGCINILFVYLLGFSKLKMKLNLGTVIVSVL